MTAMKHRHLTIEQEISILEKLSNYEPVSHGSSRLVFNADNFLLEGLDLPTNITYVIKLAMGIGGMNQMMGEVKAYRTHYNTCDLADIYYSGRFIEVMEAVEIGELGDLRYYLGDYEPEDIAEDFNLSNEEMIEIVTIFDRLNEVFGYSSDNAQLGRAADGRIVCYDYGVDWNLRWSSSLSDAIFYGQIKSALPEYCEMCITNIKLSSEEFSKLEDALYDKIQEERKTFLTK